MLKLWKQLVVAAGGLILAGCPTPPKSSPKLTPLSTPVRGSGPALNSTPAVERAPRALADYEQTPLGEGWIWMEGWTRNNRFGDLKSRSGSVNRIFQAPGPLGEVVVVIGSPVAYWNGTSINLGFSPKLVEDRPAIHVLDAVKNFEPLLTPPPALTKGRRVVVLDPGHGGTNTGAASAADSVWEKHLTLDWALRTRPLLAARGWTVWLTRNSDQSVSSAERIAFADKIDADLFVSLHFNSVERPASDSEHGGLETLCLTPVGMGSHLTGGYEDDPKREFPNNAFDAQNLQYAVRLQQSMVRVTGRKDRGVKRARFLTVLQGQRRPAVLLEGGFISDATESRLIESAKYRQQLAQAVTDALP